MSKNKDHEWLKARTIHVKGLSHEDRTGNNLKAILEKVTKEAAEAAKAQLEGAGATVTVK